MLHANAGRRAEFLRSNNTKRLAEGLQPGAFGFLWAEGCHMSDSNFSRSALLRCRAEHGQAIVDIDRKLADLERLVTPAVYGSRAPHSPPAGRSHRWLRDHGEEIGATRTGGKRGRGVTWTISAVDYARWLEEQRAAAPALRETGPTNVVDIDGWISVGHRLTRARR